MTKYKTEIKTIAGKQYDYVFCPKCEIWVQVKNFNFKTGKHPDCEIHQKSKETRKRAEGKALKTIGGNKTSGEERSDGSKMMHLVASYRNNVGKHNGYGGCLKCGDTWNWKQSHSLSLDVGRGIFPCCEDCWSKMDKNERLQYCIILFNEWNRQLQAYGHPLENIQELTEKARQAVEHEEELPSKGKW